MAGEGGKRSTIPPSNATNRIRRCRCRRTLRCATNAEGGSPRERAPWKRGTGGHEGEGDRRECTGDQQTGLSRGSGNGNNNDERRDGPTETLNNREELGTKGQRISQLL